MMNSSYIICIPLGNTWKYGSALAATSNIPKNWNVKNHKKLKLFDKDFFFENCYKENPKLKEKDKSYYDLQKYFGFRNVLRK